MTKANLKSWVQDRIIFLAVLIFAIGAACYIAAGKIFSHDSIWLHPFKEFSLLISMIGVVSFGYEIFLRELTFNEYKRALQEIVNPDAVRLGIIRFFKNRSELGQAYSFETLFKNVKNEIFIGNETLLQDLHDRMWHAPSNSASKIVCQANAVRGLGGVGKSAFVSISPG
mgnify:CR=1 FL=1